MRKRWGLILGVVVAAGAATVGATGLPPTAHARFTGIAPAPPAPSAEPTLHYAPDTPANRALFDAIRAGSLAAVQTAVKDGGDPEAGTYYTYTRPPHAPDAPMPLVFLAGYTAESEAYSRGGSKVARRAIFRLLVDRVRNINIVEPQMGQTLLMMAVDTGDLAFVKSLVARGALVDAVSSVRPMPSNGTTHPYGSETAFYQAVAWHGNQGGDPNPVAVYLLDHGADVNHVCADGSTALMRAAQFGRENTVRLLLARGAKPSLRDARGFTALQWATLSRADKVIALLAGKTETNLWEAAAAGDAVRVKALLAAGANPNEPHPRPSGFASDRGYDGKPFVGEAPLTAAVKSNDPATVRTLLDAGADAKYVHPGSGQTALHVAATYGSDAVIPLLLARGADVNAESVRAHENETGSPQATAQFLSVQTPLVLAVASANDTTVALLLKSGVKPAAHDQVNAAFVRLLETAGQEPRRPRGAGASRIKTGDAAMDAQYAIFTLLLKAGADPDKTGAVALAAEQSQPGILSELLARKASPDVPAPDYAASHGTALIAAIQGIAMGDAEQKMIRDGSLFVSGAKPARDHGAAECLAVLLKAGANVNTAARETGETPLMAAADGELLLVAETLLRHGAVLDATDRDGRTALQRVAATSESVATARWLLGKGADVNHADDRGYTALMLAIDDGSWEAYHKWYEKAGGSGGDIPAEQNPNRDGHPKMVEALLKVGADKSVVAKDGMTAAALARKNGFKAVEALLQGGKP